jgi:hypothetical protein
MVPRPRAGAVASDRAPLVALVAAGEVVIVRWGGELGWRR